MRVKLLNFWYRLRASYWFIPSFMMLGAFLLATLMIHLDTITDIDTVQEGGFFYLNQPEGARALLSTVAGSIIGVAGVTFSITMAVLSLTSSQFGPRLLRNFMRDQGNQIVLGIFVATFLYSLLVLRTIDNGDTVPQLSITVAVLLTIFSLAVFIYFIHHTAASIQISNILHNISKDIRLGVQRICTEDTLFLDTIGEAAKDVHERALPEFFSERSYRMKALKSGYLTALNRRQLMKIAIKHDAVIKVRFKTGEFITEGERILELFPMESYSKELETSLRACFAVDMNRTQQQDIGFLFQQIVEIALRALSPSINDPFTAVMCVDRLGQGFRLMADKGVPLGYRYNKGQLRLWLKSDDLAEMMYHAFSPIRHYAQTDFIVSRQLLQTISMLMPEVPNEARQTLLALTDAIQTGNKTHLHPNDYQHIVTLSETIRAIP